MPGVSCHVINDNMMREMTIKARLLFLRCHRNTDRICDWIMCTDPEQHAEQLHQYPSLQIAVHRYHTDDVIVYDSLFPLSSNGYEEV